MEAKKQDSRLGKAVLTAVVLTILAVSLLGALRMWSSSGSELLPLTTTVQPQRFSLRIFAAGELQSEESQAVAVPNVPIDRLRIASVVPDGRYVNKGDVILEFDPAELDLQVTDQRSSLEMAQQKIRKGELAVDVEKTDIQKEKRMAELELEKIKEFLPKDTQIFSRNQIIEGELDKNYTEKKITFAEARLELRGRVYSLDEAILLLERKQARSKLDQSEKALASLKLLAPASGVVVYNDPGYYFGGPMVVPGRVVWNGMTLFNLVNPSRMQAKCYVLEKDAGELRPGQKATFSLDPYPGTRYTGKVQSIDRIARPIDRDSPVKYFQTTIAVNQTEPEFMKPGIKLRAEIAADDLESVIVVPRSAIVAGEGGNRVYVQNADGSFAAVPISLGRGNMVQVVVTGGLRAGQVLALNPPDVKTDLAGNTRRPPS